MSHLPVELLNEAARERGVIGLEWGRELRSDLPTREILQWAQRFPDMQLVDGSEVIWRQRLIKSDAEVELIRRACAITSRAYARLFAEVHEGMTEQEVARAFARIHTEEGSGVTWLVITSGAGSYDFASKAPTARRLVKGDLLWLDAGCNVGGCWSDFSRGAVVGGPSDAQRYAMDTMKPDYASSPRGDAPGRGGRDGRAPGQSSRGGVGARLDLGRLGPRAARGSRPGDERDRASQHRAG